MNLYLWRLSCVQNSKPDSFMCNKITHITLDLCFDKVQVYGTFYSMKSIISSIAWYK